MIKGLAHLCLIVKDLAASEDFYCRKLGLKPAFDFRREDGTKFGMYIHAGGRNFVEIFMGKPSPMSPTRSFQHFCLEVEDFDATIAEFRRQGVDVTGVKLGSDQSWQGWLKDPDGNVIELHGYTPQSRQGPWVK